MRKPTIYEALRDKLGREPTNAELKEEVKRILSEVDPIPAYKRGRPIRRRRREIS